MHILQKINNWTQGGPTANNLNQITPAHIQMAVTIGSTLLDMHSQGQSRANTSQFMDNIMDITKDMQSKYDEMMKYGEMFMPGGEFYGRARQDAVDTAFTAATKGDETLRAKGINLSSYGSDAMQDIVKEKYTTDFTKDYSGFLSTGKGFFDSAGGIYGNITDMLSSAYSSQLTAQTGQESPGGDILEFMSSPEGTKIIADLLG